MPQEQLEGSEILRPLANQHPPLCAAANGCRIPPESKPGHIPRRLHPGSAFLQGMIACRMRIVTYSCAFCGEDNDLLVDPSGGRRQTFTEDCAVCCRPNLIMLAFGDDGTVRLDAAQEYEA